MSRATLYFEHFTNAMDDLGNATKITIPTMQTVSAFKKKIVTRIPGGEVSTPLDQRGALKIVKVNPSISIQPKKQGNERFHLLDGEMSGRRA